MGEVKRKPLKLTLGNGDKLTVFDEDHTLGDIIRWLCENKTDAEELLYLLEEQLGKEHKI